MAYIYIFISLSRVLSTLAYQNYQNHQANTLYSIVHDPDNLNPQYLTDHIITEPLHNHVLSHERKRKWKRHHQPPTSDPPPQNHPLWLQLLPRPALPAQGAKGRGPNLERLPREPRPEGAQNRRPNTRLALPPVHLGVAPVLERRARRGQAGTTERGLAGGPHAARSRFAVGCDWQRQR